MREMFTAEYDGLIAEIDNLITNILPQILLPPLPAAPLPAMMTLTAGIGGGESARFLEEMSKMYMKYAENKGWTVKIISASEGAMAKGSGGNGYREMALKFLPSEWAEDGAECFGELMWEGGTHRVQRVPPGASVDKLQSSTVNVNVGYMSPSCRALR
jgi:peptide chain release factor 1